MRQKRIYRFLVFLTVVYTAIAGIDYLFPASNNPPHLAFHHFLSQKELSKNTINCILQDRQGYMWFGTNTGLIRFDGYETKVYSPINEESKNYLISEIITCLFEDRDGILWIGSENGGLTSYNPKNGRFELYINNPGNPGSLADNIVITIYQDKHGSLWVGTNNGLDQMNPGTREFIHYRNNPKDPYSISSNIISAIIEDSQKRLWIGTDNGLCRVNEKTGEFICYRHNPGDPNTIGSDSINALCNSRDKGIWIATDKGFDKLYPSTGKFVHHQDITMQLIPFLDNRTYCALEDNKERVWIGTVEGLILLEKGSKNPYIFKHNAIDYFSLSNNLVPAIFQDRQGLIWVGTWGGGISLLDDKRPAFTHYRHITGMPGGLLNNQIFAINEGPEGIFWIGTSRGGLAKFNRAENSFTNILHDPANPRSITQDNIIGIAVDKNGKLWIGFRNEGVDFFDPAAETAKHFKHNPDDPGSLSINKTLTLIEDHEGFIWVGTNGGGLDRLNPATKKFTHYRFHPGSPQTLSSNTITTLFEESPGILWVGTKDKGLNLLDVKTGKARRYPQDTNTPGSIANYSIKTILKSSSGTLWVGTLGGGLYRFDKEKNRWKSYTIVDGLPNNVVYGILEDSHKNLWLSTNNGLSLFNPNPGIFKNFDSNDGIQANEFNTGAAFKSPWSKEMLFGGINGFNIFSPEEIKENKYIPPVAITSFKVFNKPRARSGIISPQTEIKLKGNENYFSFEFAALNYSRPERNQYAYKLEGFDKNWIKCGTRRYAGYTDLRPGTYTFRVKGSNSDGYWNQEGTSVKLVILPFFWQTDLFRIMLLLAAGLTVYLVFWVRMRRVKAQKLELVKLVTERTAELEAERQKAEMANRSKSDFLARMSHEIRTPMNAVIGFTDMLLESGLAGEQLDYAETIHRSGQSLLGLLNDILDASKMEAGQLALEFIDFDPEVSVFDVCEMMRPRLGNKPIEILCRVGDNVPAVVNGDPGRFRQVLINLMGNAVKFTEEGEVEITLALEHEDDEFYTLHITVRDTGIGIPADKQEMIFEKFQQGDGSTTRKYGGTGLGLPISRQLAVLMGGNVWVKSELDKGSLFHFKLRVKKPAQETINATRRPSFSHALTGKKALIVDDNEKNLEILSHILTTVGMTAATLTTGEEVLPAIEESYRMNEFFDICILDIRLPGISGYDVAQQLKNMPSSRPLPLIAFSSAIERSSTLLSEFGFDGFLPKPVQRQKILEMIDHLVNRNSTSLLPLKKESLATRHSVLDNAKHSVRILLVEDNLINQKLGLHLLTKGGYQVELVNNGKEAVDKFTAHPDQFDIILMDIQMPVMDGKEAARIIRDLGYKDIPIIAMTALTMKGDKEKFIAAGMNDFISKPIKRDIVYEVVKKWAIDNMARKFGIDKPKQPPDGGQHE